LAGARLAYFSSARNAKVRMKDRSDSQFVRREKFPSHGFTLVELLAVIAVNLSFADGMLSTGNERRRNFSRVFLANLFRR
jgi:hypothetical protein